MRTILSLVLGFLILPVLHGQTSWIEVKSSAPKLSTSDQRSIKGNGIDLACGHVLQNGIKYGAVLSRVQYVFNPADYSVNSISALIGYQRDIGVIRIGVDVLPLYRHSVLQRTASWSAPQDVNKLDVLVCPRVGFVTEGVAKVTFFVGYEVGMLVFDPNDVQLGAAPTRHTGYNVGFQYEL